MSAAILACACHARPQAAPERAGIDVIQDDRLARDLAALAPQRPGHPDLYVLAFAGDGSEQVFRNEALHLQNLAARRLDAGGRALVLANHTSADVLRPLPPATLANLRRALAGLGRTMDVEQDILLVYFTTHGSSDHRLLLRRDGTADRFLSPRQIRDALDAAGIRHRVIVISACYSGGFIRALRGPDTLVLTAAHRNRPSFGCGNDSVATYFGRAWLVDGLNATVDFEQAFGLARDAIAERENQAGLPPSKPQMYRGSRIGLSLGAWRESFVPGPALPYPHADPPQADAAPDVTPWRRPVSRLLGQ